MSAINDCLNHTVVLVTKRKDPEWEKQGYNAGIFNRDKCDCVMENLNTPAVVK